MRFELLATDDSDPEDEAWKFPPGPWSFAASSTSVGKRRSWRVAWPADSRSSTVCRPLMEGCLVAGVPMRVRIGEWMNLVAIVAVGLGVAQWVWRRDGPVIPISRDSRLANQIVFIQVRGVPMVIGLAIAIAGVAWAERASRRSRSPWGVGRWFASAVALYLLLSFLRQLGLYLQLGLFRGWDQLVDWRSDVADWIKVGLSDEINNRSGLGIVACWLSARLAGWRGDAKPDVVEWFGRLLLIATCVLTIGLTFALDCLY